MKGQDEASRVHNDVIIQKETDRMTTTVQDLVTDAEYTRILDGVNDLLKETYQIPDSKSAWVLDQSHGRVDDYLFDYSSYVALVKDTRSYIMDTFENQFEQKVKKEQEQTDRMINDAAAWLAYECVKCYFEKRLWR
ncbi:hypothetical protein GC093_25135 [Paenibacillus sp. LMG 31456]|uniref:Uncharacterized protein n=1 Tax=Paenibacillus foliorum TaxID=2654974 RepID=A0A972GTB1_9BACL|nr:hypothetical protein [Paenibacillus foliorum]NOU96476.1 hypothetical protein [Paenibacillus foliorum]